MSYADQPKHGSVEPLNFQNPRIYINFPHIMHHDIHIYWICLRCVQFLFARIARLRVGFTTHGTGVLWAWNWLFSDYQSIHQIRDILALLELFLICKSKIPVSPAPNITSIRFILIPGHIQMWQMTHFCGVMVINSRDSETTQECQMWSQVSTCRWISQCRVKVFYLEISWSYHMIAESRKKKSLLHIWSQMIHCTAYPPSSFQGYISRGLAVKQPGCVRTETSAGEHGEWLCKISHGTKSWKMRWGPWVFWFFKTFFNFFVWVFFLLNT